MTRTAPRFPSARIHAGLVYTSGLASIDTASMVPRFPDFARQCDDVLDQLDQVLAQHISTRAAVLRLECFLADRGHFAAWNAAFTQYFLGSVAGAAGVPARTTTIATLPIDGLLIEIQAIACTTKETP
ncbi:RidA family protein [Williamsia serinedens]|uniref:2-iminobutanoate/2-iminopropanoate deaminase n=1 Tax=Williamsia serinedens TaxID=391736 RepID=A0ABT1GY85_9NOCA|nr:RidA family protein [Williamsia serinedens]MCP2159944.1 2-iminobutanoate/2-iminopropanoate deaminase [Williamsia serinedens]